MSATVVLGAVVGVLLLGLVATVIRGARGSK
jgi:hypothetical protein